MLKGTLLVGSVLIAGTAAAAGIGTAAQVQGLVTVNNGTLLASAAPGTQIVEGARVVTAANSTAKLSLTSGCTVNMGPNQALTVTMQKTCSELNLIAQNSVPNAPPGAPAGGPPGAPPPGAVLASTAATPAAVSAIAALASIASIRQAQNDPDNPTTGAGGGIPNPPVSGQ